MVTQPPKNSALTSSPRENDLLQRESAYEQAWQRQRALLAQGFDLGTQGKSAAKPESLHERDA